MTGRVTVEIANSYACGRVSRATHVLPAPDPARDEGEDWLERWFDDVVYDLTGDGHPCGASEDALYEARIVAGPAALVGQAYDWGL